MAEMTYWPKAFKKVVEWKTCFRGIPHCKTYTHHGSSYHFALAVADPELLSVNYKKVCEVIFNICS